MIFFTDFILLETFIEGILFPAVAGAVIFLLMINSLLKNWGYYLW